MASHLIDLIAHRPPWLLWLLATILWYLWLGPATLARMLGRLSEHWFPMALILVVALMAAGQIGADLGIPLLFRDDPAIGFAWNSPALWGAFSVTVLIGQVWIQIYLSEFIDHYGRLDSARRPTGWAPRKLWAIPSQHLRDFRDDRQALAFLAATTPPFLGLLVLIAALPARVTGGPEFSLHKTSIDVLEYALGIVLGGLVVTVMVRVAWLILLKSGRGRRLRRYFLRSIVLLRTNDLPRTAGWGMATAVTAAFWTSLVIVLLTGLVLIIWGWRLIVPSLAISMLFGMITALYSILISLRRTFQLPFLIALVAFTVWSNNGAYKYRYPGMGTINGASHYAEANLVPANRSPEEGSGPQKPLLDSLDVLDAWKTHLGENRPRLLLVAVTGGAYRAGFWTAAVLDELDRQSRTDRALKGLTDHIRLITGASGGMIGASYFVAMRGQPGTHLVDRMISDTRRDSLTPVIQQLVQRDIPLIFCPIAYQERDRGVALENQWKSLAIPIASLYEDEQQGRRPSLIVSPMVIESGERMLISNLDLRGLARPRSARGEPYLRSAREFFRMFPAAQPTFGLQTAIRLSATFPYVSPAVSLPTRPTRRLVDAGYYDNYGVNLAAAWAYQYRDWIRKNTAGLGLIQIYAYPRIGPSADGTGSEEAAAGNLARGFQWLSSPIEGALGARNWSMLYRNDEQLRLLDDTFNINTHDDKDRKFETFSFEYPGGAAMNWMITSDDIADMRRSIAVEPPAKLAKKSRNNDEMARLVAWWNNKPTGIRQERAISAPDHLQRTEFEPSPELTPEIQRELESKVSQFRNYMITLGFTPTRELIKVKLDPALHYNIYYNDSDNSITVGSGLSDAYDAILAQYVHHVLLGEGGGK
jgi:hypothetical protein